MTSRNHALHGVVSHRVGAQRGYGGTASKGTHKTPRSRIRAGQLFYGELIRRYHNAGYTNRVDAITRRQLNKAANALADLIRAL